MQTIYRYIILLLTLMLSSPTLMAVAESSNTMAKPIRYDFGHQYQIKSKILAEDRQLQIYLPEGYEKNTERFPVIYVLEGEKHYQHATIAIEKTQTSGWIPASVIVGIPNNQITSVRDYDKQSERFLRFLTQEVQPFVEKNFRVSDYNTVFGHQRSGKFVLETFLKNPESFDNYIAANPRIRQDTLQRFDKFLDKHQSIDQVLYFSMGTVLDNGVYNVKPAEELAELLSKKAPKNFQWKYQYIPLHGTYGSANVTLYDALSVTFTDYQGPFIYSYQDYIDGKKMEGVRTYFKERAKKYHISDKVSVGSLMGLGFMLMDTGYPEESVAMLTENIRSLFPESIQLHRVLGRAYEKMKDYEKAYQVYEKMIRLAKQQNSPRLDFFESQLERIKKYM